ncbi:MAG: hypothetical protein IPK72_19530 [Candidatus Eisenbacteria bacterium]|nr:hypothetical protein [Candidatus Eisenbacteria bacterium]
MARFPARAIAAAGLALIGALESSTSRAQTLLSNADGSYETAYCPRPELLVPPDYGAFAERYSGSWEVVGIAFELSQIGIWAGTAYDLLVWQDDGMGAPGQVVYIQYISVGDSPAYWPSCRHYEYAFPNGCCVSGDWWIGLWSHYDDCLSYLCSDLTGGAGTTSMIKIPPGLEWPEGWQDVDLVFGPTHALGIGALVEECAPTPVESRTWGG